MLFLKLTSAEPSLKNRYFKQLVETLEIYYVDIIKPDWAVQFDWACWRAAATRLEDDHATIAHTVNVSTVTPLKAVDALSPEYAQALERLVEQIRLRHFAIRTEQTYTHWVRRFLRCFPDCSLDNLGKPEVEQFLSDLAMKRNVSASTQGLALTALVFFFSEVLVRPLGNMGFVRAKRPRRLPVVLSKADVKRLLGEMTGLYGLMAGLMFKKCFLQVFDQQLPPPK